MPQPSNGPVQPDANYDPQAGKSAVWLDAIAEAKKVYRDWNDYTGQIERLYADLEKLAGIGNQDRELQIFWATLQVIMPSIYSREPVPVVAPRFKDRRPLYQVSAEFLERASVTSINTSCMNDVMKGVRDDLCLGGRGVIWVCYDTKTKKKASYGEKTYPEWLDRTDFLNEPARKWAEVGWVAKRAWMTFDAMKERFKDKWDQLDGLVFKVMSDLREEGGATAEPKCPVWEIWSKTHNKTVWVTEGVEITLEEGEPYLDLEGFFPCPKPAFDTLQPRTVIPVPMFLQIKGQVEEINEITDRIHKLSEALKVKAFYEAGSEVGDAIEAGLATLSNHKLMIPIANMKALLTQGGTGNAILYWPVDVVAEVVNGLVLLRNEIINNIYQIIGISDIMRGSTEKDETATAQQIKAEFGSVRVRDKQAELVRIARDTVAIMAEIMAEHFSQETLLAMTQMEIPTDAEIKAQVKPLEQQARDIPKQAEAQAKQLMQQARQQAQQAANNPEMMQQAQANPQQAQQMLQQAMAQVEEQVQQIAQQAQDAVADIMEQIAKLQAKPTIEKVMKFLRDNKMRCFVLDIETDSTVAADEQMEKQQRTEFVTALGGMVNQFGAVIQTMPQLTPLFGGLLKFALAPYRVGRELDGLIDEAIDALTEQGQQPPENPDAIKAKAEAEKMTGEMELKAKDDQRKQQMHEADIKAKEAVTAAELQSKASVTKIQIDTTTALADQKGKIDASLFAKQVADMNAAEARAAAAHQRDMEMKALDIEAKKVTIASNAQQAVIKKQQGEQTIAVTAEKAKADRNKPTNGAR